MANDYKVGVSLLPHDGVSQKLAVIASKFLGIEGGIKKLTQGFSDLNTKLVAVTGVLVV